MKLKQKTGDFIVNELINKNLILNDNKGNYNLYVLKKTNIESLKVFKYLSNKFNIPLKDIGYCGLKDKYATTTQYITIPKKYGKLLLNEKNISLNYISTIGNQLKTGDLTGNNFQITIRNIDKKDFNIISNNLNKLKYGAPNYFDNQRFGSVINNNFIGKYYLLEHYEKGMKLFLTKYTSNENKIIKNLKRYIQLNWDNWPKIKQYVFKNNIKSRTYVKIINYLNNEYINHINNNTNNNNINTNNNNYNVIKNEIFKKSFNLIDNNLKKMFVYSYQSYLWNQCIKEYFKLIISKENKYFVDYNCGTMLFYKNINEELFNNLKNEKFPTIVPDKNYNNLKEQYYKIILKILKIEKLKLEQFNNLNNLNKLVYSQRNILNIPENIKYSEFIVDEANKGKYKINIQFNLNKGCYATIIIKRIFNVK